MIAVQRIASSLLRSGRLGVLNPRAQGQHFCTSRLLRWPEKVLQPEAWLVSNATSSALRRTFNEQGYVVLQNVVPQNCLHVYCAAYDAMTNGDIDTSEFRHDLAGHTDQTRSGVENTGQIMWPSDRVAGLADGPLHGRTLEAARALLGEDIAFDFDMMIWKEGNTKVETPWHQDAAYWPSGMTDTRAVSCWVALDDATIENGCLWMVPGSHHESIALRPHRPASEGSHILMTEAVSKDEGVPIELPAGSCVIWHGRTLHGARGNLTSKPRRAYITNYRPATMVEWERQNGYDHLRGGWKSFDHNTAGDVYKDKETKIVMRT